VDGVTADDPVEAYLDRLLVELRGRAGDVRRILAEVESHLDDAVRDGVAEGLSLGAAQRRALDRFGSPRTVARRFGSASGWLLPVPVLGQLMLTLLLLGGIGLTAVGVSGAVAGGMGAVLGKDFVAADPAGVTYTPARCADFLEYHPEAHTCSGAATAHHFDEVIGYRLAAGALGVVMLGGWLLARRRPRCRGTLGLLPDGFTATIGVVLFGAAAAGLVLQSAGQVVIGGESAGAGQYLSGGIVASAMALSFGLVLHRTLVTRTVAA